MSKLIHWSMALVTAVLFAACHAGHNHGPEEHAEEAHAHEHDTEDILFSPEQAKAAGLQIETVKPADFAEVLEVSGRVLPAPGAEATVTATMSGIVRYASAGMTDGKAVSAGQVLFVVNAQHMADGNPAAVAQAELASARKALDRARRLAQEQIISARELEEAEQRFQAAEATARSLGTAAQTRSISAPIGGTLKSVLVKPGDYVTAGQPLATVTQNSRLQLRADVPERHYSFVARISSATFRVNSSDGSRSYPLEELGGKLLSKGNMADDGDYFVPVTFEFDNRGSIVHGSFVQVFLKGSPRAGVLTVPLAAVTEAQGLYFVYVQHHADAYRRVEVKLGDSDGHRIEIRSGLKAGDKVVTEGAAQVRLAANATVVPEGHSH